MNKFSSGFAAIACVTSLAATAAERGSNWQGEAHDAWVDGQIEATLMLNSELKHFVLDSDVRNGAVTLSGEVMNEDEKSLAGELARQVEGVSSVDNRIAVSVGALERKETAGDRSFGTVVQDLTTTARLKIRFARSEELTAHDIEIDTFNGEVRLQGRVNSPAKKQLAERMAREYEHVTAVRNDLVVEASGPGDKR